MCYLESSRSIRAEPLRKSHCREKEIFLQDNPPRRRCWLQFSLRTLLLCVFLAACMVAVYVHLQQRGERLEKYIHLELMANRCYSSDVLSISVADMDGRKLIRPTISSKWHGETSTIVADAAWIADVASDGKSVVFHCRNTNVDLGATEVTTKGVFEFTLPTCRE